MTDTGNTITKRTSRMAGLGMTACFLAAAVMLLSGLVQRGSDAGYDLNVPVAATPNR